MQFISADEIAEILKYESLIPVLKEVFSIPIDLPKRHHHDFPNPGHNASTLLLMPAWSGQAMGVKLATVSPDNGQYDLPSIQGIYIYFDRKTGRPEALLEAKTLTKIRTAATSALASSFLSREDAATLFMVGTGALAPELIRAHASIRPISKVFVYGRSFEKAQAVAARFDHLDVEPVKDLTHLTEADIISCATLSPDPLIHGKHLIEGQHVDLVGSYRPDMREADDEVILRSSIYVDTIEGATTESGDLVIPLGTGVIEIADIKGSLLELCTQRCKRTSSEEITLFKSVGHAVEDLVAANLVVKSRNHG